MNPDHKSVCKMTLQKTNSKRNGRLNNAWWIDDWRAKVTNQKKLKTSLILQENATNIVLKSNTDSIAMIKTRNFISDSFTSSKGIEGTIIIGSTSTVTDLNVHETLLNIQPLTCISNQKGWKK
ncbi:MAG: hypothetical protein CVU43_03390 [Chloroflexi bacterium HGW-Chloroflexi-5]|jgi:hypothetical protein|nr:MAG: hypothetical protein CVU43_03390 [Chloroflexi bacterium HGW-Chloroflexi-5]